MSHVLRPVLILLLALLPLRGWAQVGMAVSDCTAGVTAAEVQQHAHAAAPAGMDAMDIGHTACHDPAGGDCSAHDHQHCVICHLAVGQPPGVRLLLASAVQHPCPQAADTPWHSADPRTLQRPPRA
ncbi:MAG: hypothetical protein ACP5F9_03260 [Thiomonas sp.]